MTRLTSLLSLALLATQAAAQGATPDTTLTLGEAARLAAAHGAAPVIARHHADELAATARERRAELLPSLSASVADGQRTFNTAAFGLPLPGFDPNGQVIGPVRSVDLRGRLTATLFAPAALGRYRGAQAEAVGAEADAAAAAEQAAAIAAVRYVEVLRTEAQVQALAADSALAVALMGIAQSQLSAGVGVGLDVTRARSQVAAARMRLIAARNARDGARIDLARALGLGPEVRIALRDSLAGALEAGDGSPDVEAALAHRADLRAADAAMETARRDLRAVRAERLPTVGVFADDGATSNSWTHLLNTYTYGVQVSIPLYEGSRADARVDREAARVRQQEVRLHDLEAQVRAELATAQLDLAAAREQLDASAEQLALAEQELAQARDRFSAGVSGNADVIDAQLGLSAARGAHVDHLAALRLARLALARAEGRVTDIP